MFFPPTCRNGSGLVSVDGRVFHVSESAADCFASTFRDRFLFEVAISFSLQSWYADGRDPMVLTNGVSHKSSFIGPAVWGFASKIKSIYTLSLVQPFTAPTFMHRKTDLLTSKAIAMKKIENNFAVTGFVAKDAEVRQFTTTSVARFPLAVARQEKNGEDTKRISAFMNIEAWRKNENTGSFDQLTKGTLLTVGLF